MARRSGLLDSRLLIEQMRADKAKAGFPRISSRLRQIVSPALFMSILILALFIALTLIRYQVTRNHMPLVV